VLVVWLNIKGIKAQDLWDSQC